jgi:hypothetical protein
MKITIILLLSLAYFCAAQSFVGSWTDSEYGGRIFICVSGSTLHMAFSEVGVGIGTISGSSVSGKIYIAGGDTLDHATTGTFEWRFNNDATRFSGSWTWDDESTGRLFTFVKWS